MRGLALGVVAAATAAGVVAAELVAWACTSGDEEAGSFEADTCNAFGELGTLGWWLAVLLPAVVFGASQAVRPLRARSVAVACVIAVLAVAFWIFIGTVVIDVG